MKNIYLYEEEGRGEGSNVFSAKIIPPPHTPTLTSILMKTVCCEHLKRRRNKCSVDIKSMSLGEGGENFSIQNANIMS